MSTGRSYTTNFNANTTGFKKGTEEMVEQLNKLNKSLVDNQYKQRDCNKVINDAKREIKELKKAEEDRTKQLENEKKRREELNKIIEEASKSLDDLDKIKTKDGQLNKEQEKLYKSLSNTITKSFQELDKLTMTEEKKAKLDEEGKKKIADLNTTIETQRVNLSQLRTEQVGIRQAISETSHAISENNDTVSDNNNQWTILKGTLANLSADVLKKLAAQIVSIGKDVIHTGEQFSASMSEAGAISGATADELKELEAAARLYGATTKFSATEAADALKYMALAGWNSQQAIAGLPAVLDLAAASGMDLGRASDIVTDYITAFGLEVEDASRFVDIMSYAMSHSNTTAEMLGEAYKNCAANAHAMGYTVEDVTAALMTMANSGIKGGEAGTSLNAIMTRLATNTKGCADALKEYGVDIYDDELKMRSLSSILTETAEIWATIDNDLKRNELAKMIAGQNQITGFQTVMTGLSEAAKVAGMSFEDYTEALKQCEGTSNEMAKTMSNNLTGDIKTLQSALDELKLKIFDSAETPLRNLVKLATNGVVPAIEGIIKNLKAVMPVIVGAATAMSTLKLNLTIGKIVAELTHNTDSLKKAFQGLTVATQGATVAQEELNVAQSANVIGLVVTAVMSLISAFGTLAVMTAQNATETDNASVKVKDYTENLRNLKQQEEESLHEIKVQSATLKELQNEYDGLRKQTSLTADEKLRLDTIANELSKTLGISTQALKDKNGAYIDITGSVDEYIKKLEEQTRLENATNGLKEAYTTYDKAKKSCEEYSKKIEEQQEIVEDSEKNYQNLTKAVSDYIKENHANPYKYQTAEYNELSANATKAKEEFERQKTALDNLKITRAEYQIQMQGAVQSEIEYKKALGQTVDEEKEWEQCKKDMNSTAEETNDILSKVNESANELSETTETATKKTETLSEKYERLNGLLEENEQAIKDVNDEVEQAMDSGDTAHIEELQSRLKDLNAENTTLKNRIKAVKDEIEKDANAIADAIENVENSMQMLQKAEKEVADNGKLSLNTLMSIQKKYPELIGLVNDYVSGVKTEKDVIAGLKEVYEKDVESYNYALGIKKIKQDDYISDAVKANSELINKYQEHYGIDLKNFMNVTEAKLAAQKRLQQAFDEAQKKRNDFQSNYMIFNNAYGTQYMKKDSNGNWKTATATEIAEYQRQMQELNNVFDKAFLDMEHFDETAFQKQLEEDIAKLYKPVNADGLFNLSGSSSSNSGSGKNDGDKKDIFTKSGYGVTATGDTYAKAYMTWVDRLKSLGKITEKGEIFWLEKLKERTDNTAEEIYQIDLKLYNARKKLADDSAKSHADIEKKRQDELQEKLNLAKAAYERLVNGRIESLQKEAQTAKDTADAEIAALDKVLAKRKQAKSDEERQKKIDFINAQLRYKQLDEFSRNELQRQKQDLLNEQAEIDFERNISAQQQAISERSSLAQNKTQQAIDGLNSAKSQFADHIAYLSGNQTYDQRVANNTVTQNIQIVQNDLTTDQLYQRFLKKTGLV